MKNRILVIFCGLAIALNACSGGSTDSSDALIGEFDGVWDVQYNVLEDECAILDGSVPGFVDVHTIEQSGANIMLQAPGAFDFVLTGEVLNGNKFVAESLEPDLDFGDGFFCDARHQISYEATAEQSASTLYIRQLNCIEDISCETCAIGEALRR